MLRDGLLPRSDPASLRWSDVEFREDGAALLQIPLFKTDQEAKGGQPSTSAVLLRGSWGHHPRGERPDPNAPVFGLSARQIGRRVNAAAKAADLGDGFAGHVGMAEGPGEERGRAAGADAGGPVAELPDAGAVHYTERQAAGRGAVARYYQQRVG